MNALLRTWLVSGAWLYTTSLPAVAQTPVGALAVDERQGAQYAWALDHETAAAAHEAALQQCGSDCSVVLTFNRCGAYAEDQDPGGTAVGWAGSHEFPDSARQAALSECDARGGSRCIVRVWGCNTHVVPSAGGAGPPLAPASAGLPTAPLAPVDQETLFWKSVMTSTNPADFRAYLDQFPAGLFGQLARNKLAELDSSSSTQWTLRDKDYFNPLSSEPRAARIAVDFPGRSDRFPFSKTDQPHHLVWAITLGREIPLWGKESQDRDASPDLRVSGDWGFGVWFPISFHMIEYTDYRAGGMLKATRTLRSGMDLHGRFGLGHESTHLGDEFTIIAERVHKDTFERINVSWEYWELAGGLDLNWGSIRGGYVRGLG